MEADIPNLVEQSQYPDLPDNGEIVAPRLPYFGSGQAYDDLLFDRRSDVNDGALDMAEDEAMDESASSDGSYHRGEEAGEEPDEDEEGTSADDEEEEDEDENDGAPAANDRLPKPSTSPNRQQSQSPADETANAEDATPAQWPNDLPAGVVSLEAVEEASKRGRGRGRGRARGRSRGRGRPRGSIRAVIGRGGIRGLMDGDEPGLGRGKRKRGDDGIRKRGRKKGRKVFAVPTEEFSQAMQEASAAYVDKDYSKALEHASQAVQINPEVWAAHNLISNIYSELDRPTEAFDTLFVGAHTAKDPALWWEIVGRLKAEFRGPEHELDEKLRYCYRQIKEYNEHDYPARRERLALYLKDPFSSKASRECRKMLRLWPKDLEVLELFAGTVMDSKVHQQVFYAKSAFRIAVDLYMRDSPDGQDTSFGFDHLDTYLRLLLFLKLYAEGLKVATTTARWLLGRREERFWDEVNDDREWDLQETPRRMETEGFEPERHPLEVYGEGLPIEIRVKIGLFRLRSGREHFVEAMGHFEHLGPNELGIGTPIYDFPDLFGEVGDALFTCYRWLSALRFYEPLLRTRAGIEPTRRLRIARSYHEEDNLAEAVKHYDTFLDHDPRHEQVLEEVAMLHCTLGNHAKAEKYTARLLNTKQGSNHAIHLTRPVGWEQQKLVEAEARRRTQQVMFGPPRQLTEDEQRLIASQGGTFQTILPRPQVDLGRATPGHAASPQVTQTSPRASTTPFVNLVTTLQHAPIPVARHQAIRPCTKEAPLRIAAPLIRLQMLRIRDSMRSGDREAKLTWLEHAEEMMTHFASIPEFNRRRRPKETPSGDADVEIIEKGPDEPLDVSKLEITDERTHNGLLIREWLHMFCEYALVRARDGDQYLSYQVLQRVQNLLPFTGIDAYRYHIHVIWLAASLALDDNVTVCLVVKWFATVIPGEAEVCRLYSAVNLLSGQHPLRGYMDPGNVEFFKSQAQRMDADVDEDAARQTASLREEGVTSETSSAKTLTPTVAAASTSESYTTSQPSKARREAPKVTAPLRPNTHLLMLIGNLLKARGCHAEALHYYLRVFASPPSSKSDTDDPLNPSDNPHNALPALCISTSYLSLAMEKTSTDRNACILQAQTFMSVYARLRVRSSELDFEGKMFLHLPEEVLKKREAEVLFNDGRLSNGLGLVRHAREKYEACLGVVDRPMNGNEDGEMPAPAKRDAAMALQQIHMASGRNEQALEVTKYLVL